MDGTLIDSGDVITNTINYVRKNLNLEKISKEILLKNLNNPDIKSSEYFYGTSEFTDDQTKLFGDYYSENCTKDISLYDGIFDLLETLNEKGYIMSVATNASVDFANKMLKSLDILKFFSYVIGADMVKIPKPAPDMIVKTLEVLNMEAKNSCLVGDSKKDLMAAEAINMNYFIVNWGFTNHDEAISDISELKRKIQK